jgi:hypothetical protein
VSERDRRRGIQALRTAPAEFTNEELVELARVICAETVLRASRAVSYERFDEVIGNLSAGGSRRVSEAMMKLTGKKHLDLTVGDLIGVSPWALLHAGAGPTTMVAVLAALLGLGVVLPPRWHACPSQAIRRPWLCALATQATNPGRLKAICDLKRVYRRNGGVVHAIDPEFSAQVLAASRAAANTGADHAIPPTVHFVQGMGINPAILPVGHPARICRGPREGEDGPHLTCALTGCGCPCETCEEHREGDCTFTPCARCTGRAAGGVSIAHGPAGCPEDAADVL